MESGIIQQWLVVLSFFVCILGFMIGEAFWLREKSWAGFGKSLIFSALTNTIGFSVGLFLLFVAVAVVLGMSWDGADKYPVGFSVALVGLGAAVVFIPVLLMLFKRLFLSILKMQTGKTAWLYSIVSSTLSLPVSFGIPVLVGYLVFR